jgi:hypothetical protein
LSFKNSNVVIRILLCLVLKEYTHDMEISKTNIKKSVLIFFIFPCADGFQNDLLPVEPERRGGATYQKTGFKIPT